MTDTTTTPHAAETPPTTTALEASSPLTAAELGELFRLTLNSGDVAAVAALAPTIAAETYKM